MPKNSLGRAGRTGNLVLVGPVCLFAAVKYFGRDLVFFPPLFLMLVGCANLSTLQTARTLPPGNARVVLGGGVTDGLRIAGYDASGNRGGRVPSLYLEAGARKGITENFEIGGKFTLLGTIGIDGKCQLLQSGGFAAAIGIGANYFSQAMSSEMAGGSYYLIDALVPVYLSYDFKDWIGIYASPKYLGRITSPGAISVASSLGLTLGIRLGNDFGVFVEGTYMKMLTGSFQQAQGNIGFFFKT